MDFIDQVRSLASRVALAKDMLQTEEATKNAMVMPFIQLLGYNVFDPLEVTPELIADVGTKRDGSAEPALRLSIEIFETVRPASLIVTLRGRVRPPHCGASA